MHVVVIVALVAALAAFVVGILTSSVPWVIASIALSAVALLLVVRSRPSGSDTAAVADDEVDDDEVDDDEVDDDEVDDDEVDDDEVDDDENDEIEVDSDDDSDVADKAPAAADDQPAECGTADGSAPEPEADLDEVWVIDGRPRYHLGGCSFLAGKDAEPVPLEQAIEDGFTPCSICSPPQTA